MKPLTSLKISQRIFVAILFFLLTATLVSAQPDGEAIFKQNCTQCHSIGKGKVIGPDLNGIQARRPDDWLAKWIRNSQAVVKSGDPYAVKLFNDYNKTVMTPFNFSDEEMTALLAYIKKGPTGPKGPTGGTGSTAPVEKPVNLVLYLLIAAGVLYVVITLAGKVQRSMEKALRQKNGMPEPAHVRPVQKGINWARNNKKLVAVILIILFMWGSVAGWDALAGIGIAQGYQPDQPIGFSHKIHAGDNAINCKYCHFGAEKGKTAGIPPANVCMNCHKFIKGETDTSAAKIQQIYKALDYNPETGVYGPNKKPIQWIRVHNLPDLSYFNHSQHVKVAGVECETCHGTMHELGVAKQFAPLTMGWCIDCHRKTPVKMEGNHYYDDYHKELMGKFGHDSLITVERIGGTECARCHY